MDLKDLKSIELSGHFLASEIFYSRQYKVVTIANESPLHRVQLRLAIRLSHELLEPIRHQSNNMKKDSKIVISGGCRNAETHKAMIRYNPIPPSQTSDHSFLNHYWPIGVGATDFYIPGFFTQAMEILYKWVVKNIDPELYGQIIIYPESTHSFIHISNPKSVLGMVGAVIRIPEDKKRLIYTRKNGYKSFNETLDFS